MATRSPAAGASTPHGSLDTGSTTVSAPRSRLLDAHHRLLPQPPNSALPFHSPCEQLSRVHRPPPSPAARSVSRECSGGRRP
eukprot:CAMPEP_0113270820 /NCGR_PEP_ID=MMETSP0008_2-20120614/22440_1 /TAXON_ID=97485 /ORGANISM="Prymnesium parvum" /LENGTH=81 /DNA_ID=CAMNT_0000120133 /DNA_START=121 /DNA_END=363 /DNA_ORIENTATION=+ /assembly_acc=CAM_ASM_000153